MFVLLAPALAATPLQAPPATPPAAVAAAAPQAAAAPPASKPAPQPAFRPINHDEDYSSFRDQRSANTWTRLKYIPIAGDSYAMLGGELRLRPELRVGERFGRGAQDTGGDFQQRSRVWGDVQIEGTLRLFVDLEHATSHDLDSVVSVVEQGKLDFNQAFAELRLPLGKAKFTARIGRQEIGIGNQTVFDMREGANARRSFDVVRVMGQSGRWDGGVLAGYAVLEKVGTFDDRSNHDFDIAAAHLGRSFGAGSNTGRIEALFLRSDRASLAFDTAAAARDQRRTLALRYAGKAKAWSLDIEGIRQWGSFGTLDIDAWYITGTVARAWQQGWKPRLALRVDVGSGDTDRADGKIGTYTSAFARPLTYNGDLGAQNLTVVQPMLNLQPHKRLAVDLSVAGLWRTSTADGVYGLGGQVLRRATESDQHFFGKRATVHARYMVNPFTTLGFFANVTKVAEELNPSQDLRYFASYLTFRF